MPSDPQPYRPSNGTEGECFMAKWCSRCSRDGGEARPCSILTNTMALGINDPGYPREWIRDDTGPRCTAFRDRSEIARKAAATRRCGRAVGDLFGGDHAAAE